MKASLSQVLFTSTIPFPWGLKDGETTSDWLAQNICLCCEGCLSIFFLEN